MPTRILITGAEGNLGRALSARAQTAPVSLEPAFPGPCEFVIKTGEELNVTKINELRQCVRQVKPDILINASGFTDVDQGANNRWVAGLLNRDAAEHHARVAEEAGARVVNFSTDLVFDGRQDGPYAEEDPPNPLSVYADTKLAGELVTLSHCRRALVIRSSWWFGTGEFDGIAVLARQMDELPQISVSHRGRRQPTYVEDLIDALFFLLSRGETGIYHVANDGAATLFEVAQTLAKFLGRENVEIRDLSSERDITQALRPEQSVLNCAKLIDAGHLMRPWEEALGVYAVQLKK